MQTYLKDLKLRHSRLSRLYSTTADVHRARQSPSANPEVLRYERNRQLKAEANRSNQANLTPGDIDRFISYFQEMTSSETTRDIGSITSSPYLASLPQLPDEDFVRLVAPITLKELTESMKQLHKGKAPGVDGLPVEFYSTFWDLLGPFLCAVLNDVLTTHTVPRSLNEVGLS